MRLSTLCCSGIHDVAVLLVLLALFRNDTHLVGVVGGDAAVDLDPGVGADGVTHLPQLLDLAHLSSRDDGTSFKTHRSREHGARCHSQQAQAHSVCTSAADASCHSPVCNCSHRHAGYVRRRPCTSAHLVVNKLLAAKARVHRHDEDQVCTQDPHIRRSGRHAKLPKPVTASMHAGLSVVWRGMLMGSCSAPQCVSHAPTKPSTCSMEDSGVAGFSTTPALHPRSLICRSRWSRPFE